MRQENLNNKKQLKDKMRQLYEQIQRDKNQDRAKVKQESSNIDKKIKEFREEELREKREKKEQVRKMEKLSKENYKSFFENKKMSLLMRNQS